MNGSSQEDRKGEQPEQRKRPEFSTWLLSLPPINLYNVELVYLAFGYRNDVRSELNTKYELRDVESLSTTTRK